MARLVRTPFGRPALEALATVVGEAQGDDPLAPVTVVVPSAPASVSVRRALGRHGGSGLANVRTLALPQLAELLADAGRLAPISHAREAAAIRAGWDGALPPLSGVPVSAALEEALLLTFSRLRDASDAELRAIERTSARSAAVVDRYRDHRRRVQGWTDRHDVLALAADAVRDGSPAVDGLGTVVVYLPRRLGRSDLSLIEALDRRLPVVVVLGVTGDEDGDRPLRRLLEQLGHAEPSEEVVHPTPPAARIVLAPDPDEEAREAVRTVLAHLEAGATDLDRIAVVSRVESPYRLLLHEHLDAAGLAHHVELPSTRAQSLPGRVLLGLLDLPDHDFRRVDVARWLRAGPIRWDGHVVPASRWDRVARRAGVVQGLDQWRGRLDRRREELAARAAEDVDDPEGAERWARRLAEVDAVQSFVLDLHGRFPAGGRQSWADWAAWSRTQLGQLLGGDHSDWSPDDVDDLAKVHDAVDALGGLDEVDAPPDVGRFRRVLADELGRQRRRVGRLGQGIQVGDLETVYGQDLDLVVVLGMAEGWHPPRRRDDPLLPDHALATAGLSEALGRPDRTDDRRDHLAVRVAGATVVLSAPRSDPRGQRELQPARWLLEELSARAGRRIGLNDVPTLEAPWLRRSPSFEDTTRTAATPIEAGERDLTALLRSTVAGSPTVRTHPAVVADARLARGLDAVEARRDRRYGEWTGDVGAREELRFHDESVPSATRLERYALCPFQYLLDAVLRVHAHEDPVDVEGITPRDRGSLVHEVLETFIGEQLGRDPSLPWSDEDRRRLEAVLDEVGEDFRSRGMTGRDLGWELESAAMRRWLGAVLDRDDEERASRAMSPTAVELQFGGEDGRHPSAEVALPDGRRLKFRGMVDRIDRAEDGSLLVLDYKTGKGLAYKSVDDDRLDRGRKLQLPIYADAARRAFAAEDPSVDVDAYYWFVEESGRKAWRGGPVDQAVQERFESVVGTIVDGIESGRFPANPGDESYFGPTHCRFCDFNRVCPSSRVDLWEGVREAPAVADYTELAEGDIP